MQWHQLHWCKRRGTKITHTHTHTHERCERPVVRQSAWCTWSASISWTQCVMKTWCWSTTLKQPQESPSWAQSPAHSSASANQEESQTHTCVKAVILQTHVKQANLQDVCSLTCFFQSWNRRKKKNEAIKVELCDLFLQEQQSQRLSINVCFKYFLNKNNIQRSLLNYAYLFLFGRVLLIGSLTGQKLSWHLPVRFMDFWKSYLWSNILDN